ncbi:MAG: DUF2330 domain-containing protein [Myxococcales bacterium]|nr:DUF2330 domain-containing protein [Myxococcales bacterium]MCB9544198.1 DUF2330 domain-containing protein [Myxococcales bacterium]
MLRRLALALALALPPASASAFCGFFVSGADAALYNDASQVVLMRQGERTVMTMSNTYQGPPEDFAMVVPVPVVLQEEQVRTLPHGVFDKIDQLSAPRLVEYWEQDPCYVPPPPVLYSMRSSARPSMAPTKRAPVPDDLGVTVEAQFTVGEYQIVILSAEEANGLDTWLRRNDYKIPDGAPKALAPYIAEGMKFFVAKVDIQKVKRDKDNRAILSPLRFDFEAKQLRLPVRLGLLNAKGKQDLIVYILHPESRYEVANYKNVFIPSNLEVEDEVRTGFGAFYTALFDETLKRAGGGAVVTEYAWQTTSCDPCPVPPLQPEDMLTLGGDVLGTGGAPGKIAPGPAGRPDRSQPFFGSFSPWTLTRLHTRYDKDTLSEDLVFVPAGPVTGGRGNAGLSQEPPGGVEKASVNNFQGRYIIRHYWTGKVACDDPQYGRWGGPPNGGQPPAIAAGDLGTVERKPVALQSVVRSALPQLGLPGKPEPDRKTRGQ